MKVLMKQALVRFAAAATVMALVVSPGQAQTPSSPATIARPTVEGRAAATRIILLGTAGGPLIRKARSQPANTVVSGGHVYVVDAGEGVVRQLGLAGYSASQVDALFLTHLHFDHTAGLASLIAFRWSGPPGKAMDIYGPPGTEELVRADAASFDVPIEIFSAAIANTPSLSAVSSAHEVDITAPTLIFQDDTVRVTAVANTHFATLPDRKMSFGPLRSYTYRFDTPDPSIVFTGDTGPSPAVVALAKNADILVTEMIDLPSVAAKLRRNGWNDPAAIEHMKQYHLTPEEIGKLASSANVGKVIITHLAVGRDEDEQPDRYVREVKRYYSGPVIVGKDLEAF
jgi:ribonuclease BN (tRNA processing enzyme)